MPRVAATSDALPTPAGPYSPSVRCGPWVYTAGQGGATPEGVLLEGIEAQTAQCLDNVLAAVSASGATEADVMKLTVYLTDTEHFAAMNQVYAAKFSAPYPARTTVYVELPAGMLIEVDAVACTAEGLSA
jgi:2-iminobutanoate/2-iminopropanoate deaminase